MGINVLAVSIYLINILASVGIYFNKVSKKIILTFLVVIYAVIFSFRSFEFPDTYNYYKVYMSGNFSEVYFEIANKYMMYFFREVLKMDFRCYLFACVFINELIVLYSCRKMYELCSLREKRENDFWALLIYFSYFGFLYNGVILRQGLGMSLVLLATVFYFDKKYCLSIVIAILAMGFHVASIVFVGIVISTLFRKIKKRGYIIWYLCILACWLLNVAVYVLQYFIEVIKWANDKVSFLHRMAYYLVTVIVIKTDAQYAKKDILFLMIGIVFIIYMKEKLIYKKILNIYMVGLTFMVLLNILVVAYRMYDFFLIFSIPLIINCIDYAIKTKWIQQILISLLSFLFLVIVSRYLLSV